jgi:hypothetical protein
MPFCKRAARMGRFSASAFVKSVVTRAPYSLFFLGDHEHNSFDNLAFANEHQLLATEDRGDTLHTQLNTLDSVWAFEVKAKNKSPIRFIALGRDATSIAHGEDNEPTGLFVSNGSADPKHLLGTAESLEHARGFFTQQHWDNNLYEILPITGPVAMRN